MSETGWPARAESIDENESSDGSTTVTVPLPMTSKVRSGPSTSAVSSSMPTPMTNGLNETAVSSRPSRSRWRKCWSMMSRLVRPRPGASVTPSVVGVGPVGPVAIMCSGSTAAPAEVPATTAPSAFRRRMAWASGVPPRMVESRSWLPPVRNTHVARSTASTAAGTRACSRSVTVSTSTWPAPRAVNRAA